jgi:hypothetical protein
MWKVPFTVIFSCIAFVAFAQNTLALKRKQVLSVNFLLNDFDTPEKIKRTSLGYVLKHSWTKLRDMSPGLSLNYHRGLSDHLDFLAGLGASFVVYRSGSTSILSGQEDFLLETDANISYKFMTDRCKVVPFVTLGTGMLKFGSHFGAYIPTGGGVQIRLSEETFLFTNLQYRFGVTDLARDHLYYSIGFGAPITGNLGK